MASVIGGVVIAGSLKSVQVSTQASKIVRATISESELKLALGASLGGDTADNQKYCKANLKPNPGSFPNPITDDNTGAGLYGDDREWGRGELAKLVTGNVAVLKKGGAFKSDITIVKIAVSDFLPSNTPNQKIDDYAPKKGLKGRTVVVYYKKFYLKELKKKQS